MTSVRILTQVTVTPPFFSVMQLHSPQAPGKDMALVIIIASLLSHFLWRWNYALHIAFIAAICASIWDRPLAFAYIYWMKLGRTIGVTSSAIILGIIYVVILCPIGFLYRRFHANPLNLRKPEGSLFVVTEKRITANDLTYPF